MSIRNLDSLFDPPSIAVIGASARVGSIGASVWHNLSSGSYQGALYAVNPKYRVLDARPVLARASDLPSVPALAVICTPPATVPALIQELARLGTHAAVVMTAGMDQAQKHAMLKAAQGRLLRILGPDCIGLLAPHLGLNASLAPFDVQPGELAFVSQSNALASAMLDWARGRGIGFSHFVTLGEHADVDFGDMLDYLASDAKTRAILLYAQSFQSGRKFMSAARAAARNKPVIVVKAGHSPSFHQVAVSGSGAWAGSDRVFDAAIARAGMLRVDTLQELFLAAQTLSRFRGNRSDHLTIFGNGGGAGVIAADAAASAGVELATLSPETRGQLDALLPSNWSHGNPIDILGDAPVTRYEQTLKILNADHDAGALLFIHAPSALVCSADVAKALVPLAQTHESVPPRLMSCWLGDGLVAQARAIFQDAGIANFDTPEHAVRAFSMLTRYRRNQAELTEAPPALLPDRPADAQTLRALVKAVLASGRETLTWMEVRTMLQACHIPLALAQQAAAGGARTGQTQELMLGSRIDPVFGPVIVFGQGGSAMEILDDRAVALPPLNIPLARALISRTRVARLLEGWGDTPGVDQTALHGVLLALSQLLAEVPEIAELEINPLIASAEGVVAQDARIRLRASKPAGAENFAIRPYPSLLEETLQWQGQSLTLRPIRPEDEALHMAFLQQLDPEDVRMRVFYSKRTMARSELARLVQIDYAREMAFVALTLDANGQAQTLGVVRAITDPDNIEAEFGVIVGSALKGRGLGLLLMQKMIAYLRTQGTRRLVATVLNHNTRMLKLADALGFEVDTLGGAEGGTRKVVLTLT